MPRDMQRQTEAPEHIVVRTVENPAAALVINNLSLYLPKDGVSLVEKFNLALKKGDRFILTGPSGSGKSSLVRAMRNLWHSGRGEIEIAEEAEILCLAQRVHLPRLSLRGILSSPREEGAFSEEEMDRVLTDVGLDQLRKYLPINQAKADSLFVYASAYVPHAIKTWERKLSILTHDQRAELIQAVQHHIEQNAINFYPENVQAHITKDVEKDLAEKLTIALKDSLYNTCGQNEGSMNLMGFGNRLNKLAQAIAGYLLQASALELRKSSKNGRDFSRELSGGEQQKIAFAQVLLQKPDIAIMDEATSAMDPVSTHKLYKLIVERLPEMIIFGIAHNRDVIPFHTLHGHLEDRKIEVREVANG